MGLTTLTRKKLIREEKDKILQRQNQEEHDYLDNQEEDGEKKTIVFRENMVQEKHALEKRQLEEVSLVFNTNTNRRENLFALAEFVLTD